MRYLLGVDLGTSGTKTVLFDEKGKVIASALEEYPLLQPHNGWAEQDPKTWADAAVHTARDVLKKSGVNPADVKGLAISGQMHGLVMLDKDGKVLRNAILWCDARTGAQCAEIEQRVGKRRLIEICANPALPGFTAPKILWVREHEPEIYKRCAHILLPKDYVRYVLTGKIAMELSDASGMNLLDLSKNAWSQEILEKLEIDPHLLPPLIGSADVAGCITAEAAKLTGLAEGTVVAGGAGDNAAAALGTGVCRDGQAFVTLGTSGVVFAHTSKPAIDPLGRVHTFCSAVKGEWTAMSCTLAAGLSLRWARDELYKNEKTECAKQGKDVYDLMTAEASKIPSGSDGLIYLPYLMGERSPVLDPDARGVFFGLTARHTRAHLTRAVMEGVTLSQRHNLTVLNEMGIKPQTLTACGGGASSPLWRRMLADCLKVKVRLTESKEGPALGAAILAGTAAGIFSSVQQGCEICVRPREGGADPVSAESSRYDKIYALYASLYPALLGRFAALSRLRAELDEAPKTPKYPLVTSKEFERYGKVIEGIDTKRVIELLKTLVLPKAGTAYVASEKALEEPALLSDIQNRVFGGLPVQMGWCAGHNRTLNCLEYHRNSELNIAERDTLLMVAPMTAVRDGIVDTQETEIFLMPKGTALLFYETTLHYAPCTADGEDYFRVCCVLPRGTNTQRPEGVCREGEAGFLTHNNKWLFAHPDSPEGRSGMTTGRLTGENLDLGPAK
ncbi:MAG: xylulokinase [Succinivibrio sp.]|nr:xylulokinase [Succinivibrio sp.]